MKIVKCIAILFLITLISACGSKEETASKENGTSSIKGIHRVEIDIKDMGVIKVELDADVAPITVANFLKLVEEGFYNNLSFHRVINGFMIQGGDPKRNGTGGSEKSIKGEFKSNGIENTISHTRGVISMARSQDNDSASSQFFIMHKDNLSLDGNYAAFGKVTSGMEIVDNIAENVSVEDQDGRVLWRNQPIIKSMKIIK